MTGAGLVRLDVARGVARVTLARPERHNALVPELVDALGAALDAIADAPLDAAVLAAEGRSFSTGGDVAGFASLPRGARRAYADRLVGGLNGAILKLIDLPFPTLARVHGPVTGGSLGLVLACDLSVMSASAFLAPYYATVGFAPDGGWTALLPERIGASRTAEILMLDRRVEAAEAAGLGIVSAAAADGAVDAVLDGWLGRLAAGQRGSILAARRLVVDPDRRARIAAGLDREKARFLDLIETDDVEAGMRRFLERKR